MTTAHVASSRRATAEANARLGVAFFLVAEAVFFVGLVFFAANVRGRFPSWPPPGAPAADAMLILVNTLILFESGACAWLAFRTQDEGPAARTQGALPVAFALGCVFLAGQVLEFSRMGGWQPYGDMFRTLFASIAALHGLHVAAGLALLGLVLLLGRVGDTWPGRGALVRAAVLYWVFVALTWPVLLAVLTVPS